ncbi:M14 family zinc carboxypeptidase [Wenjunlia tyrosinilytica]|uniref:Dehydrogenase n=1 Tax=Wenjunlia tyrosinilytica TaxID=1544741 RepID=A0A917ZYE7_9ACTN|nr:M14 family zinc carboxypeptidase [Wenjunlia tyrosinilytica]GGP00945.1 dehydrogenase [Wenjunlia tyrosinilytica]
MDGAANPAAGSAANPSADPAANPPPGAAPARYPTVDEAAHAARELARSHPDLCRLRRVGTSRKGQPLLLLSVGRGRRDVLVVAGAHANEPVGGATVLRLAAWVTGDEALRSDTAWHFLLCLDPDGARLNEAWVRGPFTLGGYHRRFYRPPFAEQPEWLPAGGAAALAQGLPETRALVSVIDELRPFLQCSLHGADIGGGFVQLTRDIPGLAERVGEWAARLRVPLDVGSYDAFHWLEAGAGVYVMPPPGSYEPFSHLTDSAVASTWFHPHTYGTVTAVVEAPMWGVERVTDPELCSDPAASLRHASEVILGGGLLVAELLERARPFLLEGSGSALAAVEEYLAVSSGLAQEWDPGRERSRARPMPVLNEARAASLLLLARRVPLRAAALLRQAVGECGARAELGEFIARWCTACEGEFEPRWVPVECQVEHQARAVVSAFEQLDAMGNAKNSSSSSKVK